MISCGPFSLSQKTQWSHAWGVKWTCPTSNYIFFINKLQNPLCSDLVWKYLAWKYRKSSTNQTHKFVCAPAKDCLYSVIRNSIFGTNSRHVLSGFDHRRCRTQTRFVPLCGLIYIYVYRDNFLYSHMSIGFLSRSRCTCTVFLYLSLNGRGQRKEALMFTDGHRKRLFFIFIIVIFLSVPWKATQWHGKREWAEENKKRRARTHTHLYERQYNNIFYCAFVERCLG